jgi:hypothetical protein
MFSRRSRHATETNPLTLALAEARGVLDLTVSNPTRAGIAYPEEILAALSDPRALVYEAHPFGLPEAREAVAREVGCAADRVVLTASTSEAYAFLFKLLCDPGDEVLVPQPSYPLFDVLADLESVKLVPYRVAYDGQWHIDLPSLKVGPRTRAILTVSPNNPTGSYLKKDELAALSKLGLPIISDEVFARYPLIDDPSRAQTVLEGDAPLMFALGGLSKLAALPQMKVAWMIAGGREADAALARLEWICDAFLSVSAPVMRALPRLLVCGARDAIAARTRENLTALRAIVADSPTTLLHVEGGWYATLRLPATQSESDWALELVRDRGVLVHPGHFFDFHDEPLVVLSLLTPQADFVEGARRLLDHVRRQS